MVASARGEAHLVRELPAHGACVCVCARARVHVCTCAHTGAHTELRSLCGVRTIDTHTHTRTHTGGGGGGADVRGEVGGETGGGSLEGVQGVDRGREEMQEDEEFEDAVSTGLCV